MTPRAPRSAVILTVVAIASAVLAATRALAGPAPAGHSVPGWARDGDRPAARPVIGPVITPVPTAPFRWPLDGRLRVVVAFDPPARPWLPGHRGVDLAATPAQLVYATGPGTVAFAGRVAGVGVVSIDHADGLRTTYEPVDATVHAGERVAAGTPIGRIGARIDSCPTGVPACLHWGLRHGGVYLDPLALLGLGRVRLLP